MTKALESRSRSLRFLAPTATACRTLRFSLVISLVISLLGSLPWDRIQSAEAWNPSTFQGSPEPPLPFSVEKIYPDVKWQSPIYAIAEPESDHLIVIQQKNGDGAPLLRRVAIDPTAHSTQPLFRSDDWLIYGMTFDPNYAENQFIYLFQHGPTGHDPRGNRISRYRYVTSPSPEIILDSERIIIQWRSAGHDGGDLAFGSDHMLYIATGDGTSDSDDWVSGQDLSNLLGAILRIDVRNGTEDTPYRIPSDNPFIRQPGARPEIWAYGLRNPWRMGIDQSSGQIWVGNNGQDLWETAHLIRRGENYGWSVYEGSQPFYPNRALGPTPHVHPTIEHSHAAFRSLTGGIVYRGTKWPELDGAYIYGDYSTGRIWGAKHDGETMLWHRELADTTLAIAGFRAIPNGDLLVVDHSGHAIYRFTKNPVNPSVVLFPKTLSATGLFQRSSEGHFKASPGVQAYHVNASGWHDGASAERWMAIPEGEKVTFADSSSWSFPNGTALIQTLSLPNGKTQSKPIETRIFLRQQNEWAGYSYRWNPDGTDATLVPKEGLDQPLNDTHQLARSWRFPSRTECTVCHSRAANFVLGISGIQLNRPGVSTTTNQLAELAARDLFQSPIPATLNPPLVNPYDTEAPIDQRARSYLHTNCAACHVEAGGGNAQIVLRYNQSLENTRTVDARPQHATFALPDARIIAPSRPDQSVLAHRLSQRGPQSGQMPPLGSNQVDHQALQLIRDWIESMPVQRELVREWAVGDFSPDLAELQSGRQYLEGKEIFTSVGCIQCHRFGNEGGSVGPDLNGISQRLTAFQILESIIAPSTVIEPKYIIPNSAPPLSTMPTGMVDTLTKDQIHNLIYYLLRDGRPRVAAVVTEYRHNSHADVIVSRLLQTDTLDGKGNDSPLELVSLFTDQVPASDTSRMLSASHRFPIFPSIAEALTLGSDQLSVDGILLIAEHGDYPLSATGNRVYPKRRFWNEIESVFENSGFAVPVFIDKHLADNWADAKHIYDAAQRLKAPLMAGSSLPTTWRKPEADVTQGASLANVVAITYHTTDAYGFHALEFIQSLVEQRSGGETGILKVQSHSGPAVWQAIDSEQVDPELFQAAWAQLTNAKDRHAPNRQAVPDPRLFVIHYRDGLRVHVLELNGAASEWTAAWRYKDTDRPIESSLFWTQEGRPGMHFTWLLNGIEQMMLTGKPSWNAERTLLTSGTLDALLLSLSQDGKPLNTPYLQIDYKPDWRWTAPPPPPPMRPWSAQ